VVTIRKQNVIGKNVKSCRCKIGKIIRVVNFVVTGLENENCCRVVHILKVGVGVCGLGCVVFDLWRPFYAHSRMKCQEYYFSVFPDFRNLNYQ